MSYWVHELGLFELQGETLELKIDDIYFIMGLSRRGTLVNLEGTVRGGDPLSMQDYVNIYCFPRTQKLGTQVPISQITSFPLKFLVSSVVIVA